MSRQWPLGSEVKRKDLTGGAMLYDASRAGNATASWFEPAFWRERGEIDGEARGRGTVYFTKTSAGGAERGLVLRHYHRGGLIANLSRDRYVWRGAFDTRAFREWQLLYHLHRAGLPVPTPVAARYQRHGPFYSADLITERLMDSISLGALLRTRGIPILGWITIGRCIRMFHDLGVCHADLNAHNILLVGDDAVYLIDFDRGRLMKPGLWCDSNLVRLRRSLEKITYKLPPEHFSEADWHGLLDGYRQSAGARSTAAAAPPANPATQPVSAPASAAAPSPAPPSPPPESSSAAPMAPSTSAPVAAANAPHAPSTPRSAAPSVSAESSPPAPSAPTSHASSGTPPKPAQPSAPRPAASSPPPVNASASAPAAAANSTPSAPAATESPPARSSSAPAVAGSPSASSSPAPAAAPTAAPAATPTSAPSSAGSAAAPAGAGATPAPSNATTTTSASDSQTPVWPIPASRQSAS